MEQARPDIDYDKGMMMALMTTKTTMMMMLTMMKMIPAMVMIMAMITVKIVDNAGNDDCYDELD